MCVFVSVCLQTEGETRQFILRHELSRRWEWENASEKPNEKPTENENATNARDKC